MTRSLSRIVAAFIVLISSPGIQTCLVFAGPVIQVPNLGTQSRASVPVFQLPGYSLAPANQVVGSVAAHPAIAPAMVAAQLTSSLPPPATPTPSPIAPAKATDQLHQLDGSSSLILTSKGELSLEAKVEGEKLFDMRREQVARQWSQVAETISGMRAHLPDSKNGAKRAISEQLLQLKRSGRLGDRLSLDAEMKAPIKGVEYILNIAASRTKSRADFVELFYGLLTGYNRGVLTLAGVNNANDKPIVNDVTQLNPIPVDRVLKPVTVAEISAAVRNNAVVSVGGGHYSMGGQTATEDSVHLDMRGFNKILDIKPDKKVATVQAGVTWRQLLEALDPVGLAPKIMQSYANFSIGGSLGVNVHGRYVGLGPLILSVKAIKVVMEDGRVETATPTENSEIFYGAIGGYGALGVIVEATLDLADNVPVELQTQTVAVGDYKNFFDEKIRNPRSTSKCNTLTEGFRRSFESQAFPG